MGLMISSIGMRLQRFATRRVLLAALVAAVGSLAVLAWRQARLDGSDLLDGRLWYTPEEAAALLESLDELESGARVVYAVSTLTADMVFPASYGLLLAVLLSRLFSVGSLLWLLPLVVAAADVLENVAVAALLLSYDGSVSSLARPAAVLTSVKWGLVALTAAAVGVGAIRLLRARLRTLRH
ncbi:MAG: hypothetical protein OXC59_00235 [Acidimicrobiaceae bacterium]|nr:hypothetical protein [Acidimicrobiaceae bacterium]